MAVIEGAEEIGLALGRGEAVPIVARYDFATDGGAVGDITLRGDQQIPSGAVIVDALLIVDTPLTSGGAGTVALKVESSADILSADAVSGAPWSTSGAKRCTLTATSAPVTTTAARDVTATVGTAALTAGAFRVVVWYVTVAS